MLHIEFVILQSLFLTIVTGVCHRKNDAAIDISIDNNPRRMHRRVTVVVLCVCLLPRYYLICESKVRCYKVPYGLPKAWFVWISPKTLHSPVLASFADSKLLDFSRLTAGMPLRINRTLCIMRYIRSVYKYYLC